MSLSNRAQSGAPITFGNIRFTGDIHNIPFSRSQSTRSERFHVNAGFNLSALRAGRANHRDLALYKAFPAMERMSFQLRAEGQDAPNYPQFCRRI